MKTIQSSLAKTHFAQILDEVERGETVQITRHGKVVACITPGGAASDRDVKAAARARLEAFRKTSAFRGLTIDDILSARNEGRK